MAEIGVGSVVHSLHVPLGGHVLSINQVLCLGLICRHSPRKRAVHEALGVATIVALLKLLSPAGKRVMPMIAIFMQGALFACGLGLLGANLFGALLGALLLSVWGFLQPLATAYVLFGETFFAAVEKMWNDFATQIGIDAAIGLWIIVGVVAAKALAAMFAATLAWRASPGFESRYLARVDELWKRARSEGRVASAPLSQTPPDSGWGTLARLALYDLLNPLFLGSLVLCMVFLRGGWEFAVRTILFTFALFFAIRAIPVSWVERLLARYPALENAVRNLR
jgi:hypothetical protein